MSPTSSTVAGTVSPNGPETDSTSSSPPSAALSTSTKPGPPSDIGARSISSSGACRRHPAAIASAASTALSVPANLSGATKIRMRVILADVYARAVAAVEIEIRPMHARDVAISEQISDEAFFELEQRTLPRDWPAPERRTPEHSASWITRSLRFVEHDAGGCWVAEDESGVVGFATSFVREQVWCLATYAVRPALQGAGVGRRLLEAAEEYGAHCPAAMLSASVDPRAIRRYWRAGFDLHPQMFLRGTVDRRRPGRPAGYGRGAPTTSR